MRVLSSVVLLLSATQAHAGFAEDTCASVDWFEPDRDSNDNFLNPTGKVRCCGGVYEGGKAVASCDTSSCVNNFGKKNLNCFNYGSSQNGNNAGSANCPYTEADKAFCDVSFLAEINGRNCRDDNGQNHCMGYVKCGTDGVDHDSDHNALSNGIPAGLEKATRCSWGGSYELCVYNGSSENWKVCSGTEGDDTADIEVDDAPDTPVDTPSSTCGDKTFETASDGDNVYRCAVGDDDSCQVNAAGSRGKWTYAARPSGLTFSADVPTSNDGTWSAKGSDLAFESSAGGPQYSFPYCCDC
jgi:hypothetical protein